jgi:hypothetical protein
VGWVRATEFFRASVGVRAVRACTLVNRCYGARVSAAYRSGPSRDWLKVKNPDSPAIVRVRDSDWG